MNDRSKDNVNESQKKELKKEPEQITVVVGEPWPDGIAEYNTGTQASQRREFVAVGFAVLLPLMLLMFLIYAMKMGDHAMLNRILEDVERGLVGVGVWAFGQTALKALSGFKIPEHKNG